MPEYPRKPLPRPEPEGAWAATWRIRQFQQIGGAPVGPWRELRRVKELPSGAPQHLIDAHHAVNRITNMEAGTVKPVSWAHYTKAQGGVYCGRNARIKVSKEQPDGMNRYGEKAALRPIGVETVSVEQYVPAHMAHMGGQATRFVHWVVESERHEWQAASRSGTPNSPAASRPWTCVNNCTDKPEGKENGGTFERESERKAGTKVDPKRSFTLSELETTAVPGRLRSVTLLEKN